MCDPSAKKPDTVPLISVIVPVYNVEPYLARCLDSVLAQTYRNLQILVTDDGSTDGSRAICDAYAARDKRIEVHYTPNGGLSAARNHALDRARGAYIAFLDGDDWMEPDMLEKLLTAALSRDADVAVCGILHNWQDRETPDRKNAARLCVFEGEDILRTYLRGSMLRTVVWNKLWRASLFQSIRFPAGRAYEDVATTYRLYDRAGRAVCLPDALIHYRERRSSISKTAALRYCRDYWQAFRERYEALCGRDEGIRRSLIRPCVTFAFRLFGMYGGFSKEEKETARPLMDEIRAFLREYRADVRKNERLSFTQKLFCACLPFDGPLFIRLLGALGRVRKGGKHRGALYP